MENQASKQKQQQQQKPGNSTVWVQKINELSCIVVRNQNV
jgi:hypothetical protein